MGVGLGGVKKRGKRGENPHTPLTPLLPEGTLLVPMPPPGALHPHRQQQAPRNVPTRPPAPPQARFTEGQMETGAQAGMGHQAGMGQAEVAGGAGPISKRQAAKAAAQLRQAVKAAKRAADPNYAAGQAGNAHGQAADPNYTEGQVGSANRQAAAFNYAVERAGSAHAQGQARYPQGSSTQGAPNPHPSYRGVPAVGSPGAFRGEQAVGGFNDPHSRAGSARAAATQGPSRGMTPDRPMQLHAPHEAPSTSQGPHMQPLASACPPYPAARVLNVGDVMGPPTPPLVQNSHPLPSVSPSAAVAGNARQPPPHHQPPPPPPSPPPPHAPSVTAHGLVLTATAPTTVAAAALLRAPPSTPSTAEPEPVIEAVQEAPAATLSEVQFVLSLYL